MDNENKVVEWVLGFVEKWIKLIITVAGISSFFAGSATVGLSGLALFVGRFQNGLGAALYLICGIFMMVAGPVVIYRAWSGRWPFITKYLTKRAAKRRFKGDFI